ncbi:hypothetical protein Lal_00015565 [Lupinus albus]|nr:hypothetical protein Lal_00015565 [Lupinus albus]
MSQISAYMTQYPLSTRTIPTLFFLPSQWPQPHNEERLLAIEESDFEEKKIEEAPDTIRNIVMSKCNEIKKINSTIVVIGKTAHENDK